MRAIVQGLAAFLAAITYVVIISLCLGPNRFQFSSAGVGAVAWVDVYVLTPKTVRAMIGVAVAFDLGPAVFAGEVFNFSLEFFRHDFGLKFIIKDEVCQSMSIKKSCLNRQPF